MPTRPHPAPFESPDHPAPRKYVLVLSCVDARLLDDLVCFLDDDNLTNRYYHVTLAGTSLGVTDEIRKDTSDKRIIEQFGRWRQTFIEHLQATIVLTGGQITDIYIVQHEDCGAFRVFAGKDSSCLTPAEELELHDRYAHALMQDLSDNFFEVYCPAHPETGQPLQDRAPFVHTFYMNLRGHIRHLQSCTKTRSRPAKRTRRK